MRPSFFSIGSAREHRLLRMSPAPGPDTLPPGGAGPESPEMRQVAREVKEKLLAAIAEDPTNRAALEALRKINVDDATRGVGQVLRDVSDKVGEVATLMRTSGRTFEEIQKMFATVPVTLTESGGRITASPFIPTRGPGARVDEAFLRAQIRDLTPGENVANLLRQIGTFPPDVQRTMVLTLGSFTAAQRARMQQLANRVIAAVPEAGVYTDRGPLALFDPNMLPNIRQAVMKKAAEMLASNAMTPDDNQFIRTVGARFMSLRPATGARPSVSPGGGAEEQPLPGETRESFLIRRISESFGTVSATGAPGQERFKAGVLLVGSLFALFRAWKDGSYTQVESDLRARQNAPGSRPSTGPTSGPGATPGTGPETGREGQTFNLGRWRQAERWLQWRYEGTFDRATQTYKVAYGGAELRVRYDAQTNKWLRVVGAETKDMTAAVTLGEAGGNNAALGHFNAVCRDLQKFNQGEAPMFRNVERAIQGENLLETRFGAVLEPDGETYAIAGGTGLEIRFDYTDGLWKRWDGTSLKLPTERVPDAIAAGDPVALTRFNDVLRMLDGMNQNRPETMRGVTRYHHGLVWLKERHAATVNPDGTCDVDEGGQTLKMKFDFGEGVWKRVTAAGPVKLLTDPVEAAEYGGAGAARTHFLEIIEQMKPLNADSQPALDSAARVANGMQLLEKRYGAVRDPANPNNWVVTEGGETVTFRVDPTGNKWARVVVVGGATQFKPLGGSGSAMTVADYPSEAVVGYFNRIRADLHEVNERPGKLL